MSRCARDNLRGQKSLGPLKMSLEMAHKVIVPQKKIMSQSFLNSGTLVILCTDEEKHSTHSISCLDSSLGRVPACDAGDPGSIPGGGKLNVCPLPGGQVTSTHYSQYKLSR